MALMRDAAVAACAPFDVVLSPTAPIAAFAAELASPTNDAQRPFDLTQAPLLLLTFLAGPAGLLAWLLVRERRARGPGGWTSKRKTPAG